MRYLKVYIPVFVLALFMVACGSDELAEGDKYFKQEQYDKAIVAYTTHLETAPSDVESLYNRAISYAETGQEEKAVADWNRILEDNENHFYSLMSLGKLYFEKKEFKESAFYYEKAYKSKSDNAEAAFHTGRAFHKSGNTGQAMKMYDLAIRINPDLGEAFLYRGALNIYLKRRTQGCSDFVKANSLGVEQAEKAMSSYCG
ncbi:MAG: tetratricopeptide repeat protein [Cyclobacteriaceae bacterium]